MKCKSINPLLTRQYARLQREEASLRKLFRRLYQGSSARIREITAALYDDCTDGDHVDHAALFRRITPAQAVDLQRRTAKARKVFRDVLTNDFPFTVTRFDRLNRLDAARAQLVLNELDTGAEINAMLVVHLEAHALATIAATIGYLDIIDHKTTEQEVTNVARNDIRPILRALYEQHKAAGDREATMLQQAMTRGADKAQITSGVANYAERRAQNGTDRLMFTEGTRTTTEAVKAVIKDFAQAFYTVCVNDGKTCNICKEIAEEQRIHPVPMEDYLTGVTAPPFHPWCRCGIEVVWVDDSEG